MGGGCASTSQKAFPHSEVLSKTRTIGKRHMVLQRCCRCTASYLEARLQAANVTALAQGRLHGVDDHVAHACPRALGDLSCLCVSDQRVADGFREQLWIGKDENPAWGRRVGEEGHEMR